MKLYIKIFSFLMIFLLVFCGEVFPQEKGTYSTRDMLEQSLIELKNSAKNLAKKNSELSSQNNALVKEIKNQQRNLESLEKKSEDLKTGVNNIASKLKEDDDSCAVAESRVQRLRDQIKALDLEHDKYKEDINTQDLESNEMLKEIEDGKEKVFQLQQKIRELSLKLGSKDLEGKVNDLSGEIKQMDKFLISKDKILDNLKKKYKKPAGTIASLKDKFRKLSSETSEIEKYISNSSLTESQLKEEVKKYRDANMLKINKLDKEIEGMEAEKKNLQDVLNQAKKKITKNNVSLNKATQEEVASIQNLKNIRIENESLKNELSGLEAKLKALEKL